MTVPIVWIGSVDNGSSGHCLFGPLELRALHFDTMQKLWRGSNFVDDQVQAMADELEIGDEQLEHWAFSSKSCRLPYIAIRHGRRLEEAAISGELLAIVLGKRQRSGATHELGKLLNDRAVREQLLHHIPGVVELFERISEPDRRMIETAQFFGRCRAEFLRYCGGIRVDVQAPVGVGCRCMNDHARYRWLHATAQLDPDVAPLYGLSLDNLPRSGLLLGDSDRPVSINADWHRADRDRAPLDREPRQEPEA